MDTLFGRWTTDVLQNYRLVQDEVADQVVAHFETHEGPHAVTRIFHKLVNNRSIQDIEEPVLAEFFQEHARLPDWADPKLMEIAATQFERHGLMTSTVLLLGSLPLCYGCAHGSHVLWLTGRLDLASKKPETKVQAVRERPKVEIDPMVRRVMQTAQFVLDNKVKNAYTPEGHGFASTLKVRLVHATIRYIIRSQIENDTWDSYFLRDKPDLSEIGAPINQEDLAGTLMSFGYVILKGLEVLGIDMTQEEKEAWIHQTNIIGYLLGIKEELLPHNYEDARDLTFSVLKYQGTASFFGKELTSALCSLVVTLTPGKAFDHYPFYLMSRFLQHYQDEIGMPFHDFIGLDHHTSVKDRVVHFFTRTGNRISDELGDMGLITSLSERFNVWLISALIAHYDNSMRAQFKIPEHLRRTWGIDPEEYAPDTDTLDGKI